MRFRTLYISHKDQVYNSFKIVLTDLYTCIIELETVVNMQITRVSQACDWVGLVQLWSWACSGMENIAVAKEAGSDRRSSIEIDVYSSVKIKPEPTVENQLWSQELWKISAEMSASCILSRFLA